MMNIIGGKLKGKKINVPEKQVRPTSALKREAIFSIIDSIAMRESSNIYLNKCFIDLFSGSGSMGLEAVSRGASFVYFYENNPDVYEILKQNCINTINQKQYKICFNDINQIQKLDISYPLGIIFIDPPYEYNCYSTILSIIASSNILDKISIIIIEMEKKKEFKFSKYYKLVKEKNYGKTKIIFLRKN